jgi:hypothetical protein
MPAIHPPLQILNRPPIHPRNPHLFMRTRRSRSNHRRNTNKGSQRPSSNRAHPSSVLSSSVRLNHLSASHGVLPLPVNPLLREISALSASLRYLSFFVFRSLSLLLPYLIFSAASRVAQSAPLAEAQLLADVQVKRGGACLAFHGCSSFPAAHSEPPAGVSAGGSRSTRACRVHQRTSVPASRQQPPKLHGNKDVVAHQSSSAAEEQCSHNHQQIFQRQHRGSPVAQALLPVLFAPGPYLPVAHYLRESNARANCIVPRANPALL